MSKINLSIIIPSFNEEENLKKQVLNQVSEYLSKQGYSYEVLIVDDGSTDQTIKILKDQIKSFPKFNLIENKHGGKAIAVMTGMLKSQGDIALFTDMDQATPIYEIEKILPKFDEGYDIVIGSRSGRKGAPAIRKLMALAFSLFRNVLLGLPFSDTQCGFKAFSRNSINNIFPKLMADWEKHTGTSAAVNAGFDVETLFIAKKKGLKVEEVPVQWQHVGTERVQIIKDSWDAVKDVVRIKINDLSGKYS